MISPLEQSGSDESLVVIGVGSSVASAFHFRTVLRCAYLNLFWAKN
jgi:hypothetical protein